MGRARSVRTLAIVAILAALGMVMGLAVADALAGREKRYTAQATLAMLPARDLPLEVVSDYWEVLNRGQATGSAAVVLQDSRWLDSAAVVAGVPTSDLTLSAGAIPETTLITATMTAGSADTAEVALAKVLVDAAGPAAQVSGAFRIETVVPPDGSAVAMSPTPIQMFGTLGIAGLLIGAGAGYRASRIGREKSEQKSEVTTKKGETASSHHRHLHNGDAAINNKVPLMEITSC